MHTSLHKISVGTCNVALGGVSYETWSSKIQQIQKKKKKLNFTKELKNRLSKRYPKAIISFLSGILVINSVQTMTNLPKVFNHFELPLYILCFQWGHGTMMIAWLK